MASQRQRTIGHPSLSEWRHRCQKLRGPVQPARHGAGRRRHPPPHAGSLQVSALFGFGKQQAEAAPAEAPQQQPQQQAVAFPPYEILQRAGSMELRLYQPYPVAECGYERRDDGFLLLGGYMSGANAAGARWRETQPIVMLHGFPQGGKRMRVLLAPREGDAPASLAALPAPTSADVALGVAGGELVAAWRFEGNATREACKHARRQLLAAVEAAGLALAPAEATGAFRVAQYGPLHSLSTRINEVWLAVQLPGK